MSWNYVPFNKTLEKVKNTNKIPRKLFLSSGSYPVISQEKDFINGYWNESDDLFKVEKPVVIFGDHTKVIKLVGFDFVMGADGVKVFLPNDKFDSAFFYYFLLSVKLPDLGYARHFKLLTDLVIPCPSIEEQQRIVAILDAAFEQIDQAKAIAQQNLQNAREIFDSALNNFFCITNLNKSFQLCEVCQLINGKAYKKTELLNEGKYRVLRVGNFFTSNHWYYSDLELEEAKYCDEGDLLYAWSASFGPRIWSGEKTIYHYHIWKVVHKKEIIDKEYLYYWFLWDKEQIKKELGAGTTMVHVSMKSMNARRIVLPDMDIQTSQVNTLKYIESEVKNLESIYQQKITALDELKQSLLQQAFSGQLTAKHSDAPV